MCPVPALLKKGVMPSARSGPTVSTAKMPTPESVGFAFGVPAGSLWSPPQSTAPHKVTRSPCPVWIRLLPPIWPFQRFQTAGSPISANVAPEKATKEQATNDLTVRKFIMYP